jgi:hypothetical protein
MQDSGEPEDAGTASRKVREPRQLGEPSAGAEGEDSGEPENETRGKAGGCRRGETRHHTRRRNWKREAEGQPEASAPGAPKDASREETHGSVAGTAGRCRNLGQPGGMRRQAQLEREAAGETPGESTRCAEGWDIRGDSKSHRRQGRKMQKPGRPGRSIGRCRRRNEERGNLNFTTECAEGRERRGNSKLGRRQSLRMQDAGQLVTSSGGTTGSAGPRGLSAGRAEGCENRGNSTIHRGHCFEMQTSGQPEVLAQG